MAKRLTVLIPCKDEEHNIRACIESVKDIADEILVADSGSTDGTLRLVEQIGGCRVIRRQYVNYGNFVNWAIPQAGFPWVLIVDADERAGEQLSAEIRNLLAGSPTMDAYRMRRENYFFGRQIKHCGWGSDTVIRLFRRDSCRYSKKHVHASLQVPPERCGTLKGKFRHYTCRNLTKYVATMNRYTTWSAEDKYAAGRRAGAPGLFFRPLLRFFKSYVLKRGFLDGSVGLIVCLNAAFYTYLKYAKLREMQMPPADATAAAATETPKRDQPPNAAAA